MQGRFLENRKQQRVESIENSFSDSGPKRSRIILLIALHYVPEKSPNLFPGPYARSRRSKESQEVFIFAASHFFYIQLSRLVFP